MAKEEESATKEFKLPEALPFGYSFMMFMEYVVDRVPEFQNVSGARKGGKILAAVEDAGKSAEHIVQWPTELWVMVCALLNNAQFQLPKNFLVLNRVQTDQLVPLRTYLPYVDTILAASDPKPKSPSVDESVSEVEAAQVA